MAMTPEAVEEAVRLLLAARGDHRRLAGGLPASCRPQTSDDGYAVQDAVRIALGARVAGWKIGCTSAEACRILNADGPFAGPVLESLVADSPATLVGSAFHMRGLECDFAFRLAEDLPPQSAPFRAEDVALAVECLHPAIEIVDTRVEPWTEVGVPTLIADNGANGALVLGPAVTGWHSTDLAQVGVRLTVDGTLCKTGSGREVMGHPLAALAWLANHRAARAGGLKAGEIVATGTCTGFIEVSARSRALADFGALGSVDLTFRG